MESILFYALCLPLPSLHLSDFYEIFFITYITSTEQSACVKKELYNHDVQFKQLYLATPSHKH